MVDDELEKIRQQKMQKLQNKLQNQQEEQEMKVQAEQQKQMILKKILTPEARSRLTNISLAKPEFAKNLELQLIQLAQSGRLQSQITDSQLKEMLSRLMREKRETKIERK